MSSPDGDVRAARRDSCSSINPSRPTRFRLRQQLDEQPAQPDGLRRQFVPRQRRAGRGRVALVEHEIDDPQHGVEPLRQFARRRHLIRNARVADLGLGADDALRQRRRRREKRPRDLLGRQAADLAQREGHLRVGRERRVAAREDETQPIVFDTLLVRPRRVVDDGHVGLLARFVERLEAREPPDAVDALEASGRHQPRARIGGNAVPRPLLERRPERLVHRFLGAVEVTEEADQRRQHAPGLGEIDGIHRLANRIGGAVQADRSHHVSRWLVERGVTSDRQCHEKECIMSTSNLGSEMVGVGAATAERASYRCRLHVHAGGHGEALRVADGHAGRRDPADRSAADLDWCGARARRRRPAPRRASSPGRWPSSSREKWPSRTSSSTRPNGFWPVVNQGQPAVLYCFIWLYLSAAGAGPWSLDALRKK